jgi:hypothetical protein
MSAPVILWLVLAAALAIVFAYRKMVAAGVDDLVHVSDPSDLAIQKQQVTAKKLQQLDRVAISLGVLTVVYGLALGGLAIYQALMSSSRQI